MFKEITKQIDNKKVVSFDIFDTLVFRNIVRPTDIFRIVENIVSNKYNISNFTKLRIEAEQNSRKTVENGEANLNEIYQQLNEKIKDPNIVNEIKKLEMKIETEFIVQNPFMKRIFDYCIENNKKILLISDMYFEKAFIEQLLKNCGYFNYNNLYVSCESRKNKGSGELFKYVKEKENIQYEEWLHIGDNYNSDYIMPKKIGLEAYNYKNINSYEYIEYNSIFESIILGTRNNFLYNGNELDYWEKFGIRYLTPLYVGFTNWIYQMTYKSDNIFFLARDGYIIEKIYKLFPGNKYTKYLYCSRNSIQIPTALSESKEEIVKFILGCIKGNLTLGRIFEICRLEEKKEYEKIIKLYGFNSFDDTVPDKKRYDALNCILAVFDDAKNKILEDRKIAKNYLIQEGLDNFEKINIVDVGWGGSIQRSIQKILKKDVRGFYFGTINIGDYDFDYDSFGYMFDQDNDIYDKARIFSQPMMYELFFSAPHGSVDKYENKDGKIIPILKKQDNHSEIIDRFQNASLSVIKEIMKYYEYYDNIDKYFGFDIYQKFLEQHKWEDMKEFSLIENDYLIGNDKKFPYVQSFSKEYALNNYKELEKKAEKSLWKGAFIIEDCNNEEEYKAIVKKARKRYYPELYPSKPRIIFRRIVPLKVRKALKNK